MNEREERIGRNDALFREATGRDEGSRSRVRTAEFVCECGNAACEEHITMALADYEAVRADPTTFAVVAGHEEPSVEGVVERRGAYDVVRRRSGDAANLAESDSAR